MYLFRYFRLLPIFQFPIPNASQLPLLNQKYNVFLGGVPDKDTVKPGASKTLKPYIGCIRDVLVTIGDDTKVTDFNDAFHHTSGIEMGKCTVEQSLEEDSSVILPIGN